MATSNAVSGGRAIRFGRTPAQPAAQPAAQVASTAELPAKSAEQVSALDFMSDFQDDAAGVDAALALLEDPKLVIASPAQPPSQEDAQTRGGQTQGREAPQIAPSAQSVGSPHPVSGPAPAVQSRAQRFKGAESEVVRGTPDAREHTSLAAISDIGQIKAAGSREVVDVKRSMAAAKVLTPLVAAISFNPGFSGQEAERTRALSEMLVGVHSCAVRTALAISDALGRDVPQWMVTQLMQGLSEAVAQEWQRKGQLDPEVLAKSMELIFGKSKEMAELIAHAGQNAYQPVHCEDDAQNRVAVSTISAAWKIYDWVTHPQLAMDATGATPSVFFTYGLEPMELVNKVLTRCVDEAQAFLLHVNDADIRTAHLQASIGRMTALVGAEYVTQTRHVMTWIDESELTDEQRDERIAMACDQLETRILPHVFEWARQNFIRIEDGAVRAMEVLNEKKSPNADLSAGGAGSRNDARGG